MLSVEDKINGQEYLEIERMLAKNAQRRKAEAASRPAPSRRPEGRPESRQKRYHDSASFERVPKADEYVPKSGRTRQSSNTRRQAPKNPKHKPRHAKSGDSNGRGVILTALCAIAAVLGVGATALSGAGPSEAAEVKNNQGTDTNVKPIVHSVKMSDVESRYDKALSNVTVSDSKETEIVVEDDGEGGKVIYELIDETEAIEPFEETPEAESPTRVSDAMIEYLKTKESFRAEAYYCPAGKLTIGWGHTAGVYEGQVTTKEEATEFLRQDVKNAEDFVAKEAEKYGVILTQGQFDAFVDFAFNLGLGGFRDSGLMEMMANGDIDGAANHILKFVKAKNPDTGEYETLGGLVARREQEVEWFYS